MEIKDIVIGKIYFSESEKIFCKVVDDPIIDNNIISFKYLKDPYYNKLKDKTKRNRNHGSHNKKFPTISKELILERWTELHDNIEDDPLIIKTSREVYNTDGTSKTKHIDYIHIKYIESNTSDKDKLKLKLDFLNNNLTNG